LDVDFIFASILGESETYLSVILIPWHRSLKAQITGPFVAQVKKEDFSKWREISLYEN
jgi:hypothetical protein